MNDSSQSEEKSEQPTPHKLKKAREKGQVEHSKDVITTALTLGIFVYFFVFWESIAFSIGAMMQVPASLAKEPFDVVVWDGMAAMLAFAQKILVPIVLLVVGIVIAAHVVILKGFVFAVEPIVPKFDKINPAKGISRIFNRKSFVEFLKSLVKLVVLIAIVYVVLRYSFRELLLLSTCDASCVAAAFGQLTAYLVLSILVFFIVVAGIDYFLQGALFRHEMKMTKTELKRELKDREGDPLIRGRRRQLAQEILMRDALEGMHHATVALRGVGATVGLRYVQGSTPLPIVVSKGRGQQSGELLNTAMRAGIPIQDDPGLVTRLINEVPAGSPITDQELLEMVALHLNTA